MIFLKESHATLRRSGLKRTIETLYGGTLAQHFLAFAPFHFDLLVILIGQFFGFSNERWFERVAHGQLVHVLGIIPSVIIWQHLFQ